MYYAQKKAVLIVSMAVVGMKVLQLAVIQKGTIADMMSTKKKILQNTTHTMHINAMCAIFGRRKEKRND